MEPVGQVLVNEVAIQTVENQNGPFPVGNVGEERAGQQYRRVPGKRAGKDVLIDQWNFYIWHRSGKKGETER